MCVFLRCILKIITKIARSIKKSILITEYSDPKKKPALTEGEPAKTGIFPGKNRR